MNAERSIAALNAAGWLLNNLYQRDDGSWIANARRPVAGADPVLDFARGDSAAGVLAALAEKVGAPVPAHESRNDELLAILAAQQRFNLANPEAASRALRQAGLIGDDGQLAPPYRGAEDLL